MAERKIVESGSPRNAQEAEAWIIRNINRSRVYGLFAEATQVSPVMAEALLRRNTRNRPLRQTGIAFFRAAIEAGTFLTTGRGIAVATDGVLGDGQHKLAAIVASGVPVHLLVAWGEPPESINVHDQGGCGGRTASQSLTMASHPHAAIAASAARIFMTWGKGQIGRRLGNDDVLRYVEARPAILVASVTASRVYSALKTAPSSIAVAHTLIAERTARAVRTHEEFWDQVVDGGMPGSPVALLRDNLMKRSLGEDVSGLYQKGFRVAAACIIAWNAHAQQKRARTLKWAPPAHFPEPV